MRPMAKSPVKIAFSSGFPSKFGPIEGAGTGTVCTHWDIGREAASNIQITEIHRALDVRTFRSRSNMKSPRIPRAKTSVAISGGVATSR
jgi:hypothetical protein